METPREFLILSLRSWSPGRSTCLSLICQSPTRHWKCIVPLQKRPRYWRMRLGGHFCPSDTSALTSSGQHHSYIVRQFKSKTRLWERASVDAQGLVPHFTVFTCWPALGVTQNEIRKGIEWELGRGRHIYWLPLVYPYSSLVAFIPTGCWLWFVIQTDQGGSYPRSICLRNPPDLVRRDIRSLPQDFLSLYLQSTLPPQLHSFTLWLCVHHFPVISKL